MALGSSSLNPLSPQHFSFIKVQCHYHQVMLKVGVPEVGPGKVDSLVCHLGGLAGAHTQNSPVSFMLCSHCLEILHNLSLRMCFRVKSKGMMEHSCKQRSYVQHVNMHLCPVP